MLRLFRCPALDNEGERCDRHRWHLDRWHRRRLGPRSEITWAGDRSRLVDTFLLDQPWIVCSYGLTSDAWWPFWRSTRVLGRARIRATCAVCGEVRILTARISRFGAVVEPPGGRHPVLAEFADRHAHPDRGHPMSWRLPLLNPAAHTGGLSLDLLGQRLEADLNDYPED